MAGEVSTLALVVALLVDEGVGGLCSSLDVGGEVRFVGLVGGGYYSAASGWPSMTMTFQGDYLGVRADGRALTLRVMDFYRCDARQICENWVCLDYGDLMRQMGVDILAVG